MIFIPVDLMNGVVLTQHGAYTTEILIEEELFVHGFSCEHYSNPSSTYTVDIVETRYTIAAGCGSTHKQTLGTLQKRLGPGNEIKGPGPKHFPKVML